MIKIKRIYEIPEEEDGYRILVDRIWPPGLAKAKAKMNIWIKDVGPTNVLKKWFNHDPAKWEEFKTRYFEELKDRNELINTIIDKSKEGNVTFLYASIDTKYNGAIVLKEYVESKIEPKKMVKEEIIEKEIETEEAEESPSSEEEKETEEAEESPSSEEENETEEAEESPSSEEENEKD